MALTKSRSITGYFSADIEEPMLNVRFGGKATCLFALQMSAFDPKRTLDMLRQRQELFLSDALEHRYAWQNSAFTLAFGGNRFGGS